MSFNILILLMEKKWILKMLNEISKINRELVLEPELELNTLRCFYYYTNHLFTWSFIHSRNTY